MDDVIVVAEVANANAFMVTSESKSRQRGGIKQWVRNQRGSRIQKAGRYFCRCEVGSSAHCAVLWSFHLPSVQLQPQQSSPCLNVTSVELIILVDLLRVERYLSDTFELAGRGV